MKDVRQIVGVAALLVGAVLWRTAQGEAAPEPLSPLGRQALDAMGRHVRMEEARHFRIFCADQETLNWIGEAADAAYELADRWFRGEPLNVAQSPEERLILFIIEERAWARMIRKAELRDDGLAMQAGRELYVRKDKTRGEILMRVAHEIAHQRARHFFPDLPVWLEEGLAGMVGWDVAVAVRKARGWVLMRPAARPTTDRVCSLEEIVRWSTTYPSQPEEAARFQRCSEAFVRALNQYLGYRNFVEFVRTIHGRHESWDLILRNQFGFTEQDFESLKEAKTRVMAAME